MDYEEEVKDLLGSEVYKRFLRAVDDGTISLQQMNDIAAELGGKVRGEFKREQESTTFKFDRSSARKILSNWYQYELARGPTDSESAVQTLTTALKDENIYLLPLAKDLIEIHTSHQRTLGDSVNVENDEDKVFAEMFPNGHFSKKDIRGVAFIVFRLVTNNEAQSATKEWETLRKSIDHPNIVKFHHSYSEGGRVRSFVLEPLIIAGGSLADGAQQRKRNLREFNIWWGLSDLSSALSYLHSHPNGPVLAQDLSPHTVIRVHRTEEERKARLVWWKLLLLGAAPEFSLPQVRASWLSILTHCIGLLHFVVS